mmetsp:Transcript_20155/g.35498  ORF Transcript_20155/g.35498 Transcript_20155/m.35498 type:complete len:196 (+) Transcript_20155:97-684(+)
MLVHQTLWRRVFVSSRGWIVLSPSESSSEVSRSFSVVDKIAENQIAKWLKEGGAENLKNKGKELPVDRHRHVANSLGLGHDYVHSKILADNNIKPESVQRRIDLDRAWEQVQREIQTEYAKVSTTISAEDFSRSEAARSRFERDMELLNQQAKRVNDAIISDSLRFNGRSPVRHARAFHLEERIKEALNAGKTKQ